MEIKEEGASEEGQNFLPTPQANDTGDFQFTSIQKTPNEPQLEFILACKDLVAPVRDRKLNTLVQISVIHPAEQGLTRYSSTEIVEGTRDPLFLTGVTFPSEYPIYEETKIKLTVYDVKDKSHDTVRTSVVPEHKDPPPEVGETQVQFLHQEDSLEKRMAAHSRIIAWRIPWTEEPGGLQSMGLQRVRHGRATNTLKHALAF